jgi:hypothetical protein
MKYEYDFGTDADESHGNLNKDFKLNPIQQAKFVNQDIHVLVRGKSGNLLHA